MKNIFVLDKNYKKIGTLSNEGANPQAPYYEDLYTQELETGADTYQFSTTSSKYTQDILEIGNHIMFAYKNKYELFTITSLEYSHYEGYKTIGVYAEGIGFDLLEVYMERPEVPEKEENKDNGGSDKIYIDEDGNIIYDPDGDGETGGDITIDGDGNIIYTPSKNNKKNDSLEFKNISYPRFLSMLLKNSGWSYSCQPGLESVKHDITVRYDTNIYAILQDSMQAYRGVELQFSYAMMGGQVHKIIMAYKDGGRGSFVGKRFEYGTNVRGITKMQEVADSQDDTVLYVDDVGIAVQYDVDFALKSAEVPEIEIGDTHYVIDRDFYPPMTIKARIGKIEISFSDPTKNKIYLANNKRISGSAIEDEFNEDDIKDIIDDYDPGTDPDIPDSPDDPDDPDTPTTPIAPAASSDNLIKAPRMHAHEFLVYVNDDHMQNDLGITEVNVPTTGLPPSAFYDYIMDEGNIIVMGTPDDLGAIAAKNGIHPSTDSQPCLRLLSKRACSYDAYGDPNNGSCYQTEVQRSIFSTIINEDTDKDDFGYYTREKNNHGDEHLLDVCSLTCATILALRQHLKKDHNGGSGSGDEGEEGGSGNNGYFDNISVYNQLDTESLIVNTSATVGNLYVRGMEVVFPDGTKCTSSGWDWGTGSGDSGDDSGTGGSGGGSTGDLSDYATIEYVDGKIDEIEPAVNEFLLLKPDIEKLITDSGGSGGGSTGTGGTDSCGAPAGAFEADNTNGIENLIVKLPTYFEKSVTVSNNNVFVQDGGNLIVEYTGDGISTEGGYIGCHTLHASNQVNTYNVNATMLNGKTLANDSDKSLKENIRYIDAPTTYSNDDLLEKSDLHDFIVNQVNICEYNFIDDDKDKIGFIANEYEGTKVGDKIVTRNKETDLLSYDVNNLLFATIGALQEEVRIKDEKIANLEDRLAKIEAMLGINDNN